ncbi:fibronectin type III domain-containing protein [Aquimarina gracilis]|uniref:Fibronectin type III domain-containing protein n=1 Tax=Aquimarina gracilis TaxID=874422 RepID=A0ABU5ZY58_9FLAO|nr:fibronectin type III domain-containing protein [Aquimarina gracilis]MEB3346840.1 fibronectin type III domain-containing protein [Aquimarina gracilis]
MKNIYITICTALLLLGCSDDEGSITLKDPFNIDATPTIPSLVYPTNNLVCTNFDLNFQWNPATSDITNEFMYEIEIATQPTFENILLTANTSQTSVIFNLEKGTTYFWRIKAFDNNGNESPYTSVQAFITEPDPGINTIPYVPELITPALRSTLTENNITLEWNGADADGDPLLYDVYFGETNPPALFAENLASSFAEVTLDANKEYFWRVVVKDDQQGVSIGQVWSFKTD